MGQGNGLQRGPFYSTHLDMHCWPRVQLLLAPGSCCPYQSTNQFFDWDFYRWVRVFTPVKKHVVATDMCTCTCKCTQRTMCARGNSLLPLARVIFKLRSVQLHCSMPDQRSALVELTITICLSLHVQRTCRLWRWCCGLTAPLRWLSWWRQCGPCCCTPPTAHPASSHKTR